MCVERKYCYDFLTLHDSNKGWGIKIQTAPVWIFPSGLLQTKPDKTLELKGGERQIGILGFLQLGFDPIWNWDFGILPYLKLGFGDSSTPHYTPLVEEVEILDGVDVM